MIDWGQVITSSDKSEKEIEQNYLDWKNNRSAQVSAITVQVGGNTYQGDEISQSRIAMAITSSSSDMEKIEWTLADNTTAEVTILQLREVLRLAVMRQTAIWNDGRPSK
ncbi:DUF4376 domain-containing protein [Aeromonas veronii]